jgi:hypothetical protein
MSIAKRNVYVVRTLLDFSVLALGVAHPLRLELFDRAVEPDEHGPCQEKRGCAHRDRGGAWQVSRIAVQRFDNPDQAFDRQRNDDYDEESGKVSADPCRRADVHAAHHFLLQHSLRHLQRHEGDRDQTDAFDREGGAAGERRASSWRDGLPQFHCRKSEQAQRANAEDCGDGGIDDC